LKQSQQQLEEIAQTVSVCTQCRLCDGRTITVPGEGAAQADLMFIGEGPGYHEDQQGRPFVGRSGDLLTKMIKAMGWERDEVFIGNVVKCRPPDNRKPLPDEMETCLPYLRQQIETIQPKVIVCLGKTALEGLFSTAEKIGITKLRGTWHHYGDIPVMPTFHPAYLLRSPGKKRDVWEDLQAVMEKMGKPLPPSPSDESESK
jgi:DNA polymerase